MNIIDKTPINEPCIGTFIEEDCAVGQLADNCIYLITSPESDFAKEALDIMAQYKQRMDSDDYYYDYDLAVVSHIELKNHPQIKERVELYGDNFLIQLPSYNAAGKKRFIVAKTNKENIFADISQMMYAAERVAKFEMTDLLRSLVDDDVDEFIELARNAMTDRNFQSKYLAGLAEQSISISMSPKFGMAASPSSIRERLEIEGPITHQQRMEMYDRLFDNLKKYHKTHDPKIEAELDFIFSIIDPVTMRMFFLKLSPKLQEKMYNFVNPKRLAEASTMDVKIVYSEKIDTTRKNDGHYRLFLSRGDEQLMVHFSRSAGFVLYLIYLIDRKKNGDKVNTLNISQYKELFGKLYKLSYGDGKGNSGEAVFTDMTKNFNAKGNLQSKGLYTVLDSIREDIGKTCERMQEPAEPYLLRDTAAHLAVLPQHIIIPDEIMAAIDTLI